jgi:hypothetical protein
MFVNALFFMALLIDNLQFQLHAPRLRSESKSATDCFVSAQAKLSIMPLTWPLTRGVIKRNDVYFLALRPASASLKPACEGGFA